MKKLIYVFIVIFVLVFLIEIPSVPANAQTNNVKIKEINFVFLHGAGGSSCSMQLLSDKIMDMIPEYISSYQKIHPDIYILPSYLNRCYPNNVDIDTWANNIVESIKTRFRQKNLILIGHSMGGKTALYATARGIGQITDYVSTVVTINSPVRDLARYYFVGGMDYWQAQFLIPQDKGVLGSLGYYDSSEDGKWVGTFKHWLALTSSEPDPQSNLFDTGGVDPLPRDMDDMIVPISAQYAEGADVVYYGHYAHSEFSTRPELASKLAKYILDYIFGNTIECSEMDSHGTFSHQAGFLPVTNEWNEIFGEVLVNSGSLMYSNPFTYRWLEWSGTVGDVLFDGKRSSFAIEVRSLPLISGLKQVRWYSDDQNDTRLFLHIKVAPFTTVYIRWTINGYQPRPAKERDHYEVNITTGTPFTSIGNVSWVSGESNDFRISITSQAQGPLRWFEAEWKTFYKKEIKRDIITELTS